VPGVSRKVLFGITAIGLQLMVLALLLELGVRGLARVRPDLRRMLYMPTALTSYDEARSTQELIEETMLGFKPGGVSAGFVLNSRGFRTQEYAEHKRPGVFRVAVIGDSFAFASGQLPWGLSWPVLLEQGLARQCGCPVEVLGLGMPGVGLSFEKRMWELEARHLEPDLVLLAFYTGNDFTDESGTAKPEESALFRVSRASRLARNSWRAYSQDMSAHELTESQPAPTPDAAQASKFGSEILEYRDRYDPESPFFTEEVFLKKARARSRLYRPGSAATFDKMADRARALVGQLAQSVQSAGVLFAIAIIPDELQVSTELRDAVLREGESADALDLDRPQRSLLAVCEEFSLACIDLLPAFRSQANEGALYRLRDTHWNPRGNTLAASELTRGLAELELVPR
jgi:hypothetical protein